MQILTIDGISGGQKQLPPTGNFVAASIGCGSVLDLVEIAGRPLGIGGIVPCGPGDNLSCLGRGRLSDRNSAYDTIRTTSGGLDLVEQVADTAELILWEKGENFSPPPRRAPLNLFARVPFGEIPIVPFGVSTGLRVMRAGCPGRKQIRVWVWNPDLNPGDTVDVLLRTRRYSVGFNSADVTGERHGNLEQLLTFSPAIGTLSTLTADDSSIGQAVVELNGAQEMELYLSNNTAGDEWWYVAAELVDP